MNRRGKILSVLVLLAIVAAAFILSFKSTPPKGRRAMPSPNGWHELHAAGEKVNPQIMATGAMDTTNMPTILALIRSGLSKSCRMPPEVAEAEAGFGYTYFNRRIQPADNLLAALILQSKLDAKEGREVEAIQAALDSLRMNQEYYRGGGAYVRNRVLMFDGATAIEHLTELAPFVGLAALRLAAKGLEEVDTKRETLEETMVDTQFKGSVKDRAKAIWTDRSLDLHWEIRKNLRDVLAKHQRSTRDLMITFAARAFQLEHGRPPRSTADLVPTYLKAVPSDPQTGKPLPLPP